MEISVNVVSPIISLIKILLTIGTKILLNKNLKLKIGGLLTGDCLCAFLLLIHLTAHQTQIDVPIRSIENPESFPSANTTSKSTKNNIHSQMSQKHHFSMFCIELEKSSIIKILVV